jgi:NADPH:quinone reductase-like Zn-dependent oxidoreductase
MSSMASFRGIYLGDKGDLTVREIKEPYTATGDQSLIAVKYSAINPADLRHFYMGMYSYIAGYEWIGPVVAIGPESPFKVGEVLFGFAKFGHQRPMHLGAHQDYLLTEPIGAFRLPNDMLLEDEEDDERVRAEAWKQAVSWTAASFTASDMLFNCLDFSFPGVPGLEDGTDPTGRAILIVSQKQRSPGFPQEYFPHRSECVSEKRQVKHEANKKINAQWGGSSSVGQVTIQMAKAAGFSPIFTTASTRNHKRLLRLGATQAFDYCSPTVIEEIRGAVAASGKELSVIADAVTTGTGFAEPASAVPLDVSKSSPAISKQALTERATDVRLVGVLVVDFDPDWKFCVSWRDPDLFPHDPPEYRARTLAATEWMYKNHRKLGFGIARIRTVQGAEEGIKAIHEVFKGNVSMEKVVIEHPM